MPSAAPDRPAQPLHRPSGGPAARHRSGPDCRLRRRSPAVTAFTDIASSIGPLKHARDHVGRWMRTRAAATTPGILGFLGAKAEILYQPKGVVGVIGPWNFPVNPHLYAR